jgi:hypothetical protein
MNSASLMIPCVHRAVQPQAGSGPFSLGGCGGDSLHFGCFVNGQAPEKSQFDNSTLTRIELCQPFHRIIESHQIEIRGTAGSGKVVRKDRNGVRSAFGCGVLSSVIHQNLTHHARGQRKEMRPVLPFNGLVPREAQVGFVHKGGWLQCMSCGLARQGSSCDPPQFFVDQRYQGFPGIRISLAPSCEQFGDRLRWSCSHRNSLKMKDLTAS